MSETRVCGTCGEEKSVRSFYKNVPDKCRACLTSEGMRAMKKVPLSTRIEKHRQEREMQRALRTELKSIARARIRARRAKKRVEKRAAIENQVPTEVAEVDAATKELAQRTLARRRLIEFIKEFHPRYKAGWVHHDICRRLEQFMEDVAAGKSPRLMLLMPPRHGKSQIASKLFPAFVLGHHPEFEFIASSYNVSLALEFSREVRGVVKSDRYSTLFPKTKPDPEIQAAEAWKILSPTGVGGGGYVAAGIGGPITGKGAHILVIDDPIKNAEEADSLEQRNKIWDWYKSAAYTRLAPGGGVLVIQTCWHDDDLAGRLQQLMKENPDDEDVDKFEIVKYPAIATEDEEYRAEGEALHPERYDIKALNRIKRNVGPRFWAALYQQDPVPDDGAYFRKEMLVWRREGVNLEAGHVYQVWDFAISDKRQNDWNVGITAVLDYDDNVHVMEVRRFKTRDSGEIVNNMLDMYDSWKRRAGPHSMQLVGVEDGQIWRAMEALLKKRISERRLYPALEVMKPTTDKQVRARPLQGRMQQGKVTFPQSMDLDHVCVKELLRFPAGVHDDFVDALAWLVTLVLGKAPPRRPAAKIGKRGEKTVAEKVRELARGGGKGSAGPMSA